MGDGHQRAGGPCLWSKFIVMDFGWKARCGRNHTQSSQYLIAYVLYISVLLWQERFKSGSGLERSEQRGSGPNDWEQKDYRGLSTCIAAAPVLFGSCAVSLTISAIWHIVYKRVEMFVYSQTALPFRRPWWENKLLLFCMSVAWLLLLNIILYHLSWCFPIYYTSSLLHYTPWLLLLSSILAERKPQHRERDRESKPWMWHSIWIIRNEVLQSCDLLRSKRKPTLGFFGVGGIGGCLVIKGVALTGRDNRWHRTVG